MKKLIGSFLLATSVAAAPAFAGDTPFYVGVQLGDEYVGALGGYKINEMFAVELNYNKFDTESALYVEVDAWSIGVAGVANFPLTAAPGFSLFAKLGVARTEVEATWDYTSLGFDKYSVTEDDIDFTLGGGARYDFNQDFAVSVGIDVEGPADSLYINGLYTF